MIWFFNDLYLTVLNVIFNMLWWLNSLVDFKTINFLFIYFSWSIYLSILFIIIAHINFL